MNNRSSGERKRSQVSGGCNSFVTSLLTRYSAATPPPTPLKTHLATDDTTAFSPQQMAARLQESLAGEGGEVKTPRRFSNPFPAVDELVNVKQKKKVGCDAGINKNCVNH